MDEINIQINVYNYLQCKQLFVIVIKSADSALQCQFLLVCCGPAVSCILL